MICLIMIDHESVLKAGKGAASLNDFVYCRVACEFTPAGTKVWFNLLELMYLVTLHLW